VACSCGRCKSLEKHTVRFTFLHDLRFCTSRNFQPPETADNEHGAIFKSHLPSSGLAYLRPDEDVHCVEPKGATSQPCRAAAIARTPLSSGFTTKALYSERISCMALERRIRDPLASVEKTVAIVDCCSDGSRRIVEMRPSRLRNDADRDSLSRQRNT